MDHPSEASIRLEICLVPGVQEKLSMERLKPSTARKSINRLTGSMDRVIGPSIG